MRVVLVNSSFFPREGGAERQLRLVFAELAARGSEVVVYTEGTASSSRSDDLAKIRIRRSCYLQSTPGRRALFIGQSIASQLPAMCRPDVVVSGQLGAATTAAAVIARRHSVPHLVRLAGGGSSTSRSEAVARAASRIARTRIRTLLDNQRTFFTAPAKHLLEDLVVSFPWAQGRSTLLPNGVADGLSFLIGSTRVRDVVWYGRSGASKQIHRFLDVARQSGDIAFSVIGMNLSEAVQQAGITSTEALLPNVQWLGWVDSPEGIIAQHSVALLTSDTEGMPNFGLQAIAVGTAVVATENAGTRELREYSPQAVYLTASAPLQIRQEISRALTSRTQLPPSRVPTISGVAHRWSLLLANLAKGGE
jgi:glycosyltransferase involved in cell wall biosynthesis